MRLPSGSRTIKFLAPQGSFFSPWWKVTPKPPYRTGSGPKFLTVWRSPPSWLLVVMRAAGPFMHRQRTRAAPRRAFRTITAATKEFGNGVCGSVGACVFGIGLWACATAASAFDDAKYPDWKGQWTRARVPGAVGQPPHDPSKPPGRGQQAPLTAEYQAKFEANLADQAAGGQGTIGDLHLHPQRHAADDECLRADRIRRHAGHDLHPGRAHRAQPAHLYRWPRLADEIEPSWVGYSIGKWVDEDGDGRYDVLEVETRGFKGPRAYDASGCRCTTTTRACSRSASISTRPTRTSCTTR